jgi:glutathione S-transferase
MKPSNLKILIGDKSFSSWSMRPWLALQHSGLKFTEEMIPLDRPETAARLKKLSPTGRVPVLHHGSVRIWDSLAICEYVAELAPQAGLWPENPIQRAIARSLVCEMHSGFQSLRSQLSMDLHVKMKMLHLAGGTIADIRRICHIWDQSIRTNKGPFLLGEKFGIADAFFAPVVLRFQSYGVDIVNRNAKAYMGAILDDRAVKLWVRGAKLEKPFVPKFD